MFGSAIVGEWLHNLSLHSMELNEAFGLREAMHEFKTRMGWIIGLH